MTSETALRAEVENAYDSGAAASGLLEAFLKALDCGQVRAAQPAGSGWQVNAWVKKGILLAFRASKVVEMEFAGNSFFDKQAFPLKHIALDDGIRLVPGGSAIRKGAFLGKGVVIMPPTYVNVGAYVDSSTMLDSHVLIGSCAQVGNSVHVSAGVQVGGVLEPVGSLPVIVEDHAFIGGNCGLFSGVLVRKGAVLAPGLQLTPSVPLYDCVNETVLAPENGRLEVPENAVVVPGVRMRDSAFAQRNRLGSQAALIVKYRDGKTDAAVALEEGLR
ncbi:MAG: 2,3,4,5-tetrahydropyridine-2,6-dicarboxylate N-succinyltransferase [Candidatus Aenigmarchaeota archaeon]|nr:2,3,4,5-tetrahydropyridine-2,6-dicarboxylate N-succinyltransferase [Candidatus Aenigmarchaeota archaeon]